MKKRLLAFLGALLLLFSAVAVHAAGFTAKQLRIADALHHVGLFLGTGSGYELNRQLTRTEGMVLLVRMLGQEQNVQRGGYECPFTDVAEWAVNYVGYAYENGITRGYSDTEFGAEDPMTDYMFLTLTLRALGYNDKGANTEFVWDDPYALAQKIGLISSGKSDKDFIRADAVEVFWNAFKQNDYELAHKLIRWGVFTEKQLSEAIEIYTYGRIVTEETTRDADGDTDDATPEVTAPNTPPAPSIPQQTETTTLPPVPSGSISYEEYIAMSGEEQEAYFMQFSDPMAFFVWLETAKAEYDAKNPSIDIGDDGNIDLGGLGS